MRALMLFVFLFTGIVARAQPWTGEEWMKDPADTAIYLKEIFRIVELQQKDNRPLQSIVADEREPGRSLCALLCEFALGGKLKAYGNLAFKNTIEIAPTDLMNQSTDSGRIILSERWVLDRRLGRMVVKIDRLALCRITAAGKVEPVLWYKYGQLRELFNDYLVRLPDSPEKITLQSFMESRYFLGRIFQVDGMPVDTSNRQEIFRIIELQQKENLPLRSIFANKRETGKSICALLRDLVLSGKLKAYGNQSFKNTVELAPQALMDEITDSGRVILSELWISDRETGRMVIKMDRLGLCTVTEAGKVEPVFWFDYAQLRELFSYYLVGLPGSRISITLKLFMEERHFKGRIARVDGSLLD